jgi:hypothetical protein
MYVSAVTGAVIKRTLSVLQCALNRQHYRRHLHALCTGVLCMCIGVWHRRGLLCLRGCIMAGCCSAYALRHLERLTQFAFWSSRLPHYFGLLLLPPTSPSHGVPPHANTGPLQAWPPGSAPSQSMRIHGSKKCCQQLRLPQQAHAAVALSTMTFMHASSHLVLSCLQPVMFTALVQQIIMLLSGASVNLYLALALRKLQVLLTA